MSDVIAGPIRRIHPEGAVEPRVVQETGRGHQMAAHATLAQADAPKLLAQPSEEVCLSPFEPLSLTFFIIGLLRSSVCRVGMLRQVQHPRLVLRPRHDVGNVLRDELPVELVLTQIDESSLTDQNIRPRPFDVIGGNEGAILGIDSGSRPRIQMRLTKNLARLWIQPVHPDAVVQITGAAGRHISHATFHQHAAVDTPGRLQLPVGHDASIDGSGLETPTQHTVGGTHTIDMPICRAEQELILIGRRRRIDGTVGREMPELAARLGVQGVNRMLIFGSDEQSVGGNDRLRQLAVQPDAPSLGDL